MSFEEGENPDEQEKHEEEQLQRQRAMEKNTNRLQNMKQGLVAESKRTFSRFKSVSEEKKSAEDVVKSQDVI